jgi:MFS family permease
MAIYAGVIVGGFGGYVADEPSLGWRFALTACGLWGMLYAIPLVILLNYAHPAGDELADQKVGGWGLAELFTNRSYLLLVACFTLPALAGWVARDWMPAVLKQQFDIGQGPAGVAATLSWQMAAIVGAILGGWLADRWVRRTARGRTFVSAIGLALIPAILGVGIAPSLAVAVAFLAVFGLGWGFFDVNNMPILSQLVRPRLRATGYGVMNFVSISCGGFADWGFGALRDRGVSVNVIFGALAAAALVSVALMLLIRPNPDRSTSP